MTNHDELHHLMIGINRIYYEAMQSHWAFYSIDWNNNRKADTRLPTALYMLLKAHYQVYVIEITKILINNGNNFFLLNKALNSISSIPNFKLPARELRSELRLHNSTIEDLRKARNEIYAHLDEDYHSFKIAHNNIDTNKLHATIEKSIHFLNEAIKLKPGFDFRNFESPKITEYYDLVYKNIINTESSKSLY